MRSTQSLRFCLPLENRPRRTKGTCKTKTLTLHITSLSYKWTEKPCRYAFEKKASEWQPVEWDIPGGFGTPIMPLGKLSRCMAERKEGDWTPAQRSRDPACHTFPQGLNTILLGGEGSPSKSIVLTLVPSPNPD
ncbi:hypothetical protein MHYP_G00294020 [Metynnis hypsauchen]